MKSHKYSLFLSVASICMLSSTLVAADVIAPTAVVPQLGNGNVGVVEQGTKGKPSPDEAAKVALKASQSQLVGQVVDPLGNQVKTEEASVLGDSFEAPKTSAPVVVKSPQVGAEQHDPLTAAPVVLASPQNLAPGVQQGLPVAQQHDPLTSASPVMVAAPGAQLGLPLGQPGAVVHNPGGAVELPAQQQGLVSGVVVPGKVAPDAQQQKAVALGQGLPVVQQHDPLTSASPVLVSPQNLAGGAVQQGLPVVQQHDPLTSAINMQNLADIATANGGQQLVQQPILHEANNIVAPVIDPNAVEKATIQQVEKALVTPDAEKVVDALVTKKLEELAKEKALDAVIDPAGNVANAANDIVVAPVKNTKKKLTEAQVAALGSANAKIAAKKKLLDGAELTEEEKLLATAGHTEEEQAALAAVEAIKAEKAQKRAEAAALTAGQPEKLNKMGLTAAQASALKAKKKGIPLTEAQQADYDSAMAILEKATAEKNDKNKASKDAAALRAAEKAEKLAAAPVVTESVEPNLDALFDASSANSASDSSGIKKDDAVSGQSAVLNATMNNAPAPVVVDDSAGKEIETITKAPEKEITAKIVLKNGIPSIAETLAAYNVKKEVETVKTGEVAVNAANDANAPKPLTPEEEAAAKKKAEEEAEAAKKKAAENGDKAAPKALTAEEEAEAAKKKAEEEAEAAKKKEEDGAKAK